MKKIKTAFALLFSVLSLGGYCADLQASQKWVNMKLGISETNLMTWVGIKLSESGRPMNGMVVVTTNDPGSVTYTGPCLFDDVPSAKSLSLTFGVNDTEAIVLTENTIPGNKNTTVYAWDGSRFVNVHSEGIRYIEAPETIVNVVETNKNGYVISYAKTVINWTATANGMTYRIDRSGKGAWLTSVSDSTKKARLSLTTIPKKTADYLTGVTVFSRRSVSKRDGGGDDEERSITLTIESGKVNHDQGDSAELSLPPGGITFTLEGITLDPMPDPDYHECDIEMNSDCKCKNKDLTEEDVLGWLKQNDQYQDFTIEDFSSVSDYDNWLEDYDEAYVGNYGPPSKPYVGLKDLNGNVFALERLDDTQCWLAALAEAMVETNEKQKKRRDAYVNQQVCDKGPDQEARHDWTEKTCGDYTWEVCKRNSSHKKGSEQHEFNNQTYDNSFHYCLCRQKKESHIPVNGEKKMKSDGSGWTMNVTCAKCPWPGRTIDHTCEHKYCKPCSGGDGCALPCPTCEGGNHNFSSKPTSGRCVRCKCEGCGRSQRKAGIEPTREMHTGWDNCHYLEAQENNTRSKGVHCCCECGDYSHDNKTEHDRRNIAPKYEQCTENDGVTVPEGESWRDYHWVITESDCEYCGDPQGVLGTHTFEDVKEGATHKWLSNEKCAKRQECEDCKYGIHEEEEEAGGHADGETLYYIDATDEFGLEVCRRYFTCSQCQEECYEDTEHVVDYDNECQCKNGCGYQFEHVYENEDACGNIRCTCGKIDPSVAEMHIGFSPVDGTYHKCKCGLIPSESHIWGQWYEVSRTDTEIIYKRKCVSDKWGGGGCGQESEENRVPIGEPLVQCTEDNHVPLTDKCGCDCGYYTDTTISDDEKYHKWDEEKCKCKCGHKHKFLTGNECKLVCAGWRDCGGLTAEGKLAEESQHVPATTRCGCLCTALDNKAKSAKFHPQAPGSCRCYGANGDGRGAWHYPEPKTGCNSICRFSFDGTPHYANLTGEPVRDAENVIAPLGAHTPSVGMACGCACGDLSESNWEEWNDIKKFHKLAQANCGCACTHATPGILGDDYHRHLGGSCLCVCENSHKPIYAEDLKCIRICRGDCGLLALKEKTIAEETDHTPSDSACGCECGDVTSESTHMKFHEVEGSPKCLCQCKKFHSNGEGRDDCYKVCRYCFGLEGMYYYAEKDVLEVIPDDEHTFGNYCECACDAALERAHLWPNTWTETETGNTEICSTCEKQITEYCLSRECKRPCSRTGEKAREERFVWRGHDMSLHNEGEDSGNDREKYCSKHQLTYTGDTCPQCEAEKEDEDDGGSSGGGETDGGGNEGGNSGNLNDIFIIIA